MPPDRKPVVFIGRATLDFFPTDDQLERPLRDIQTVSVHVGGSPANTAVGLQRLGGQAAIVCRVSADDHGALVRHFLAREGVDTRGVVVDPDHNLGLAFHSTQPGAKRFDLKFYRDAPADLFLSAKDIKKQAALLRSARAVLVSGTGLSAEPSRGANLEAVRLASKAGAKVVVDLDWREVWKGGVKEYRRVLTKVLPGADLVVGNDEELQFVAGGRSASALQRVRKLAPKATLVVKHADAGSTGYAPGAGPVFVPPFEVRLLSIRGAGDGFMAGFLKGWLFDQRADLAQVLRLANAVGAWQVTKPCCASAMPTLAEIEAFLTATPHRQIELTARAAG